MATSSFLGSLLEILPRAYLNQIARDYCGIADPLPVVRSTLKARMTKNASDALRLELVRYVGQELLPNARILAPVEPDDKEGMAWDAPGMEAP